jgi:hypothetical protein
MNGFMQDTNGDKSSGRLGFFLVILSAVLPYVFHVVWRTIQNGAIDQGLVYAVIGLVGVAFGGKWAQKKEEVKADIAGGEK